MQAGLWKIYSPEVKWNECLNRSLGERNRKFRSLSTTSEDCLEAICEQTTCLSRTVISRNIIRTISYMYAQYNSIQKSSILIISMFYLCYTNCSKKHRNFFHEQILLRLTTFFSFKIRLCGNILWISLI